MYASFFPRQWQIVSGHVHFLLKLHFINSSKELFGNMQASRVNVAIVHLGKEIHYGLNVLNGHLNVSVVGIL